MPSHSKYYQTAGITIQLNSDYLISDKTFHAKFNLFEVMQPGEDNVIINHHFFLPDAIRKKTHETPPIFQQDHWQVYKFDTSWIYRYTPLLANDPGCQATAVFNTEHTLVDVYAENVSKTQYQTAEFGALTLFNTDQILFAKLLCLRDGMIMHSNGFNIKDQGILLAGASGAGKSTLSQMLKNQGLEVMCDDRMFITQKQNRFLIHGNWCHGTVLDVGNLSAPLKAIFFLEQATENRTIKLLDATQKAHLILQSLVKPFLVPEEWEKTLLTVTKLIRQVDCYTLKFDLSGEAFAAINKAMNPP